MRPNDQHPGLVGDEGLESLDFTETKSTFTQLLANLEVLRVNGKDAVFAVRDDGPDVVAKLLSQSL